MDPLVKIREAHQKGILPDKIFDLVKKRFPIVLQGIDRIEKASGLIFQLLMWNPH